MLVLRQRGQGRPGGLKICFRILVLGLRTREWSTWPTWPFPGPPSPAQFMLYAGLGEETWCQFSMRRKDSSSFFFFYKALGIKLRPSPLHSKHFLDWTISILPTVHYFQIKKKWLWRCDHAHKGPIVCVSLRRTWWLFNETVSLASSNSMTVWFLLLLFRYLQNIQLWSLSDYKIFHSS